MKDENMKDENALVAPPDKYFYTIDGKILTNMHQLSEYLKSCSTEHFLHHVSPLRNDFYNWAIHVFGIPKLANSIKDVYDPKKFAQLIDEFMSESGRSDEKTEHIESKQDADLYLNKKKEETAAASDAMAASDVKLSVNQDAATVSSENKDAGIKKESNFREFSDEELEKFTKFGVKDKETSADEKMDYLKTELNELRNIIKDLRKTGKDMILADLLLRVVEPKIAFYDFTKSHEDYEKILKLMNDVRKETDYAGQQAETTIADDIIKQLELQRIMLKKDLTPKKQGVLGKIFKPASQEA